MSFPTLVTKSHKHISGFTIIELMVVIIVIGVIGGIIFSGAGYLFEKQSTKQTKTEIEVLKIALGEFKREYGEFPETFEDDLIINSSILLHALLGTHFLEAGSWERVELNQERMSLLPLSNLTFSLVEEDASGATNPLENDCYLIDPWGEPYIYQFPRKDGNNGYLLYSKGPDRTSEPFNEIVSELPLKRPEDSDNIPPTEPGNW